MVCAENTELTNKHNDVGIEWCCDYCLKSTVYRRSSFLIPEDEGDDDESETGFVMNPKQLQLFMRAKISR